MNPVAFTVGGFEVRWNSLFILLGIIISWMLISKEAKKFKIENDFITNMLFWVIIFGIIGVPRNSPIKASTCFLIRGVNSTEVGLPIP